MNEQVLQVKNVSFSYSAGAWQLDMVSFTAGKGEITAIIGPNGSGKSTLLRIATGIIKSASGSVDLMGRDIGKLSREQIAQDVGYLPQSTTAAFDHTVEEVVSMGRYSKLRGLGFLTESDRSKVIQCMEFTDTLQYRSRSLSQLSGGERQRVMLASVLAQQPKLLLLDEPTTGLDIHHQVSFFRLLKQLAAEGLAVAVVTHELNLASLFCNRLLLLKDGKLFAEGSAEETLAPEVLRAVYPGDLYVGKHPLMDKIVILPAPDGVSQ